MLWGPNGGNEFLWQASNVSTTRPAAAFGTSITPGASNVKGSYATVLSAVAFDVYGIEINFNSNAVSATIRDAIADIGVDPAGGTSFSILIPDLLVGNACTLSIGPGINYYFPLFIKAGSSIGVRSSVNNATAGTFRVVMTVFGKPRRPELAKTGQKVVSCGIVSASSRGTVVTPGTTSDGAWTALTASLSNDCWWWQLGMGINDTTMGSGGIYYADLSYGDGTNNAIIIRDQAWVVPTSAETLTNYPVLEGGARFVKNGTGIYVRSQCSGTADSNVYYAAWGVVN